VHPFGKKIKTAQQYLNTKTGDRPTIDEYRIEAEKYYGAFGIEYAITGKELEVPKAGRPKKNPDAPTPAKKPVGRPKKDTPVVVVEEEEEEEERTAIHESREILNTWDPTHGKPKKTIEKTESPFQIWTPRASAWHEIRWAALPTYERGFPSFQWFS
jgi:hypothetical protein